MPGLKLTRRDLFRLAASAAVLAALPTAAFMGGRNRRLLVLVDLKGGNDGLNTLAPYRDRTYREARPTLALKPEEVIDTGQGFGMHPALRPLAPLWEAGEMAWVHGLGYAPPNRSHFRSIDIWNSASTEKGGADTGWLARVLPRDMPLHGIALDGRAGPLKGAPNVLQMDRLDAFLRLGKNLRAIAAQVDNPALEHVLRVWNRVSRNAKRLAEALKTVKVPAETFPNTPLGRQMMDAARLAASGLPLPVVKVRLNGFDTHAGQKQTHAERLEMLAGALRAFADTMRAMGRWNDVLVVTYSEFGRRVAENASKGTDHGTAAAHFLLGGRVRGGHHGTPPGLEKLDNGDLIHTADFRALYHTLATDWLEVESPWAKYGHFDVIA